MGWRMRWSPGSTKLQPLGFSFHCAPQLQRDNSERLIPLLTLFCLSSYLSIHPSIHALGWLKYVGSSGGIFGSVFLLFFKFVSENTALFTPAQDSAPEAFLRCFLAPGSSVLLFTQF